jgi:NrS-1  polymerase HBD domain
VSGTGVHVLAFSDLPPGGKRRNGVELYSSNRYFILTGQHLADTPTTIQERTAGLTALYQTLARPEPPRSAPRSPVTPSSTLDLDDATLLANARAARNGAQFSALWRGEVSAYGGDDSAADLALANLLAFWTGRDAGRMDRLFRQSGLMRPKWDSRRGESTYGQPTIDRAMADCANVYEPVHAIELDDDPSPLPEATTLAQPTGPSPSSSTFSRDPTPSPTPPGNWPTLHPDAYVGLLGDLVHAIAPHTEADPVALLGHALGFWGSLIGRIPHAVVGAVLHFVNEYFLFIGSTSIARKGTAEAEVRSPMAALDPAWSADRVRSGLSSGEGLIEQVRDPVVVEEPVKVGGKTVGRQPVLHDAGVADKRLCIIEPEFAKVLRVSRREGNTLSATLRQGWDSGELRVMTRHHPIQATSAHISILAHCTPHELRKELKTVDLASGFLNRFVLLLVRRSQFLPDGGTVDPATLLDLVDRLTAATDAARRIRLLTRDRDATEFWAGIYPGDTGSARAGRRHREPRRAAHPAAVRPVCARRSIARGAGPASQGSGRDLDVQRAERPAAL